MICFQIVVKQTHRLQLAFAGYFIITLHLEKRNGRVMVQTHSPLHQTKLTQPPPFPIFIKVLQGENHSLATAANTRATGIAPPANWPKFLLKMSGKKICEFPVNWLNTMPIDTPLQLQMALHRFREEVIRNAKCDDKDMTFSGLHESGAEEGLMADAQIYWSASIGDEYKTDIDMSDED
ncbi:hypothetical protein L1049_023483 [Liquidambar formosana]|uniref:Uncharacterized protein n=1 Tax=Liquidambar formosana TaxID=63359 RepID=A0AAP0RZ70_LIQFO